MSTFKHRGSYLIIMLITFVMVFIWSSIHPVQRGVWLAEMSPTLLLSIFLILTYRKFPLTLFSYVIILLALLTVLIGAHYAYAKVPLFKELSTRNHFDRFGHVLQGMVPIVMFREYFIRTSLIRSSRWLVPILISISVSISSIYELFQFLVGQLSKQDLMVFLGTQGDRWDSLWDILCALIGATIILFFVKWQDKEMALLKKQSSPVEIVHHNT